ncbi:S41 family peptidase [Undibacterium sp. JH2W]|uniref:S41 family peptidase n=1 Tax=Undibacterium sp. JH2W TaxID=3413037 RepID=UPI003BF23B27
MLSFKQSSTQLLALSALTLILSACGGSSSQDARQTTVSPAPLMQAAPVSSDVMQFAGKRQNYRITRTDTGFVVLDTTASIPATTVGTSIKVLQFTDFRVNLTIADKSKTLSTTALNNLIDLYIAFFNCVPDADGLVYWIDQYKAGATEAQIAESFYLVAAQSPELTGYTSYITNDDFIRLIYKNVLSRSGSTAPNAAEVDYWSSQLKKGASKGSIVRAVLVAARDTANDPNWSWVAALLNNKLDVANYFAVQQGLSYLTRSDNITKNMAIAAAVTSNSTSAALDLIGVSGNDFSQIITSQYGTPDSLANICTPAGEKNWVRAHLDDAYLWYKDIINVPQSFYSTPQDYFQALIVKSKDRFSFTIEQGSIDDYFENGTDVSFGFSLTRDSGTIRVRYVQPGSPADRAQIKRGATLISIDNTPISSYLTDTQYGAIYPVKAETHSFQIMDNGSISSRPVTMTATTVMTAPVLQSQVLYSNGKKIGYMVFTDHIRTAEAPLISTITQFKQEGISDLVLDLRYNGGGYLYIANELAAMIAGKKAVNYVFEKLQFNDKHPDETAGNIEYFYETDSYDRPLPQLNLPRVFVLTGSITCSASESVINSLKPFMDVILIGDTTCGKPYGFIQTNNCNTAYFAIQFSGVNALNQGDFTNGFTPTCRVSDSLNYALGDQNEPRLSAALKYANTGACPTTALSPAPPPAAFDAVKDREPRPWRNNKLLKVNSKFR